MKKEDEISEEKEIKIEERINEDKEKVETEIEELAEKENLTSIKKEEEKVETEKVEDVEQRSEGYKTETKKDSKKLLIIIPIIAVIVLFLSTIFAIINMNNNNIVKGVYIEDVEISELTKEEVKTIIEDKVKEIEDIEINYAEYSETVKLEDLGIEISAKDAIKKATSIGKSENILIDNFNILKTLLLKTKLELDITINEEKFSEMLKNIQAEIPGKIQQYEYEIKNDKLIITNGRSGNVIVENEFKTIIISNIKKQFNGIKEASEIIVKYSEPEKIDIEKIYKEIYKEAKDAYIIEEPFELHKEEDGVDLAITIEDAKKILSEEKETYTIQLKITKPKIKVKDLGDKLFKQTLAKYTTIYDASNYNRSHNVALAAKTLNGTILLPGETFSYNGKLGNTNAAKGYKEATAYVGGKVVPSYGGGICQVSSTLYNAVLYANLEIVERYNHSYVVNYVPAGRDATVAYGGKDFKFKNSRTYPIKIVSSAKNGVVSISIVGIKEEKEYEVVLTSSVLSTTPNNTTYEDNSALPEGTEKVIQKGYTGKTSIAYKILKYNGKTISKTVLSKDTYKPMNRIVQIGTKKQANSSSSISTNTNVSTQTNAPQSTTEKTPSITPQTATQRTENVSNNISM